MKFLPLWYDYETARKIGILTEGISNAQAENNFILNLKQKKATKAFVVLVVRNIAVCPTLIGGKQLAYLNENEHKTDDLQRCLSNRLMSNYQ